jgi:nucleotide-binding universal stress UspA family protein
MKTVLVPIDFSDASTNALSFAAELSKRAFTRLVVVTVVQKDNEEETRDRLKAIESDLIRSHADLKCESFPARGKLIPALNQIIADHHPDLIVMGTKGASGLKEILIGSNTVNVIAKTKVPVLVIPEAAQFKDFLKTGKNRIVLATDLDSVDNNEALDILKQIALLIIQPKVRILNVRPKNTHLDFTKGMEREALLSLFNPEIESERVTVFRHNIMSGLNFYLNKNDDTGLIVMIARNSGHLFKKHYTREMASHTHLPLLVLHDSKA